MKNSQAVLIYSLAGLRGSHDSSELGLWLGLVFSLSWHWTISAISVGSLLSQGLQLKSQGRFSLAWIGSCVYSWTNHLGGGGQGLVERCSVWPGLKHVHLELQRQDQHFPSHKVRGEGEGSQKKRCYQRNPERSGPTAKPFGGARKAVSGVGFPLPGQLERFSRPYQPVLVLSQQENSRSPERWSDLPTARKAEPGLTLRLVPCS